MWRNLAQLWRTLTAPRERLRTWDEPTLPHQIAAQCVLPACALCGNRRELVAAMYFIEGRARCNPLLNRRAVCQDCATMFVWPTRERTA